MTNKPLILGVAAALWMAAGQVSAQTACPTFAPVTTIEGRGFTCTLGDEVFSRFSIGNVPTAAMVEFGIDGSRFALTLDRDGTFFPVGTVVFDYTVAVVPGHQPIDMGTLGVDVSTSTPVVSTSATMNSMALTPATEMDGGTSAITFSPGVTTVAVTNTSVIPRGSLPADLNTITNDFVQSGATVPEPMSLSLFALGLAGLGFVGRRKRRN